LIGVRQAAGICFFMVILVSPLLTESGHVAVHAATTESTEAAPGALSRLVVWVFEKQRQFHEELVSRLQILSRDGSSSAALYLILVGFLYGIFHAAGPGHGKAIIATYLITQRELFGRGIVLAVASAFLQGLVALTLVYGLIYLVAWVPKDVQGAVSWTERISYLLIVVLGVMLGWRVVRKTLFRATRAIAKSRNRAAISDPDMSGEHDHHHAHLPDSAQIAAAGGWGAALGVIFSIGLRPCSGAILVLVIAQAMAVPWYGVGAVFAMSTGTALTVAALATLALAATGIAERVVAVLGVRTVLGAKLLALAGSILLIWMGINLLTISFRPAHPLGF
jgi:ABC-type nickel/cobalt efflux system permease component RcnA